MGWKGFIAKKVAITALTLFILITINFFLFRILPGDPARLLFKNPKASKEALAYIRERFGIDKPLWVQYLIYIRETLVGNFGWSFVYNEPVMNVIARRLPNTLLLIGSAAVVSTVIGIILGAIAGWKKGTKTDFIIFGFSVITTWLPSFWVGIILLLIFGWWLRMFPLGGITTPAVSYPSIFSYWADVLWHMTLPMVNLLFWYLGEYVLLMRSSMLDVLAEDYIVTARAKGLKERVILINHAMRNALLPVVTLTTINLGFVVAGAIQTEIVFSWPGLGRLMYDSLVMRDYPLLQGTFLILAICVIAANFFADLIYGYLDPRIRVRGEE